MLTVQEQNSVQYLLARSDEKELYLLKERAESEIETINTASQHRTMTPKEVREYDFASEILKQLDSKQFDKLILFSLHQQSNLNLH